MSSTTEPTPTSGRAPAGAPVLAAAALAGQRGERLLFEGLDLQIEPGQVVWLRGRNGRGKTSLLRIMAGLSSPAQGAVLCDGLALNRQGAEWRHRLLYVAHASALKEDLTVAECLSFSAALQGRRHSPEEIHAALAHWGISGLRQAPVRTLSQGQRRRVALARLALCMHAELWLLDEPFDALDADGIAALNGLLSEHAARGGATLLTSHQTPSLLDPVPRVFDLDRHGIA